MSKVCVNVCHDIFHDKIPQQHNFCHGNNKTVVMVVEVKSDMSTLVIRVLVAILLFPEEKRVSILLIHQL